jgi:hypothetical protein
VEYHLHGLTAVARVERQWGKEKPEKAYSAPSPPGTLNLKILFLDKGIVEIT